jgi:hypothetical protein
MRSAAGGRRNHARCGGSRPGSTHATRRDTGSIATPSGTGREARFASVLRSGCGTRSTTPRWREPGRSLWAGTTSPPSGRRTGNRSGPFDRSGSGGRVDRDDRRHGRCLPAGMVRRIVAVLLEVGHGKMDVKRQSPRRSSRTAGPSTGRSPRRKGLCLRRVVLGTGGAGKHESPDRTENDDREDIHGP